jgi:hypothetical protein
MPKPKWQQRKEDQSKNTTSHQRMFCLPPMCMRARILLFFRRGLAFRVLHSVGFDNEAAQKKTLEPLDKSQVPIEQRIQPRYQSMPNCCSSSKTGSTEIPPRTSVDQNESESFLLCSQQ